MFGFALSIIVTKQKPITITTTWKTKHKTFNSVRIVLIAIVLTNIYSSNSSFNLFVYVFEWHFSLQPKKKNYGILLLSDRSMYIEFVLNRFFFSSAITNEM